MQEPLFWILEPATRPSDEEGQIYEEVIGKRPDQLVAIYHGAEVDPDASARDGRQRYRNVPMICVRNKGEKDFTSEALTEAHRHRYPRAHAWWLQHQSDAKRTRIELLPGITPADVMELQELGIFHAEPLADAEELPGNLQPWRALALRLRSLAKPRLRLIDGELKETA